MRFFLRSKIQNAVVSQANVNYSGSIGIDSELLKKAGILPYEKVLVVSLKSGERLETYVIEEAILSGIISINGAAAKKIKKGEKIIIMSFELSSRTIKPRKILVSPTNKFLKYI